MTKWRCVVCTYVQQGWKPPSHCPICGAASDMFEKMEEEKEGEDKNLQHKRGK